MAGESARAQARAKRERGEALLRQAEHYERGARGEEATAIALMALPSEAWRAFHDVHWPGRPQANIDHVVVGPPGVFVIDSKNWSGQLRVVDGELRRDRRSERRTVEAVTEAAEAVRWLVPALDPRLIQPVLCFTGDAPTGDRCGAVEVVTAATIAVRLGEYAAVLDRRSWAALVRELERQLVPATQMLPPEVRSTARHEVRRTPPISTTAPASRRPSARPGVKRRQQRSAGSRLLGLLPGLAGAGCLLYLAAHTDLWQHWIAR